jgi:hypothetical protein
MNRASFVCGRSGTGERVLSIYCRREGRRSDGAIMSIRKARWLFPSVVRSQMSFLIGAEIIADTAAGGHRKGIVTWKDGPGCWWLRT